MTGRYASGPSRPNQSPLTPQRPGEFRRRTEGGGPALREVVEIERERTGEASGWRKMSPGLWLTVDGGRCKHNDRWLLVGRDDVEIIVLEKGTKNLVQDSDCNDT